LQLLVHRLRGRPVLRRSPPPGVAGLVGDRIVEDEQVRLLLAQQRARGLPHPSQLRLEPGQVVAVGRIEPAVDDTLLDPWPEQRLGAGAGGERRAQSPATRRLEERLDLYRLRVEVG